MQELLYIEKKSLVRVPIIGDRGISTPANMLPYLLRIPTALDPAATLPLLLFLEKGSMLIRLFIRLNMVNWATRCLFAWFGWSRTPGRMIFLTHGAIFAKFRGNNRIELRHCSLSNSQSIRKTM